MGTGDRGTDMNNFLCRLGADKKGATVVEYGLIVSLIIIAIVGAVNGVASTTTDMWNNVSSIVVNNS
jgi:pilus assembly protein Flp/PilA